MKIKTSELQGPALDWAVAKCEQGDFMDETWWSDFGGESCYSTDWAQGGPIIEREEIFLAKSILGGWTGSIYTQDERVRCILHEGDTPLIAAMRCYVASKLGDEVEVPDEIVS